MQGWVLCFTIAQVLCITYCIYCHHQMLYVPIAGLPARPRILKILDGYLKFVGEATSEAIWLTVKQVAAMQPDNAMAHLLYCACKSAVL